jgi:hypothetical protein
MEANNKSTGGRQMNKITMLLLTAAAAPIALPVFAQDAYLCISDSATGLSFDKATKKWDPTYLRAGNKYVFRRIKPEEKQTFLPDLPQVAWELFPFGKNGLYALCDEFDSSNWIFCQYGGTNTYDFQFNKNNSRFQLYYPYGYLYTPPNFDEGNDTPFIEIGTCSPL